MQVVFVILYESLWSSITVGSLYNSSGKHVRALNTPLNPIYIAKLGYTGVYLFFLFVVQNIDCGYSLELPRLGGSKVYPRSMF